MEMIRSGRQTEMKRQLQRIHLRQVGFRHGYDKNSCIHSRQIKYVFPARNFVVAVLSRSLIHWLAIQYTSPLSMIKIINYTREVLQTS
jgi:hypothetical protein